MCTGHWLPFAPRLLSLNFSGLFGSWGQPGWGAWTFSPRGQPARSSRASPAALFLVLPLNHRQLLPRLKQDPLSSLLHALLSLLLSSVTTVRENQEYEMNDTGFLCDSVSPTSPLLFLFLSSWCQLPSAASRGKQARAVGRGHQHASF